MLVSSLIPQNDVEELGKLPQLFRHYRFHAQPAQGGLSLGQFLVQHYSAGVVGGTNSWEICQVLRPKRAQSEHDSLPLRGQHQVAPLVYLVPATAIVPAPNHYQWITKARYRVAQPQYTGDYQAALLQPPRA